MERRKASFLLPGLVVGALVLVLAGARRPGEPGGLAAGMGVRGVAGSDGTGGSADAGVRGAAAGGSGGMGARGGTGGGSVGVGGSAELRGEGIAWMTIEEAEGKLEKAKKPVIIDLYTTWCGWCRQMDKKTYSNRQVAEYLREKFYTVKIDAETRAMIRWAGKTYSFNPQYRSNEFALYLTHGKLEFPTTIIIPPGEEPQAIPGYLEPKELELLVKYFGDGIYKAKSFEDYQKGFRASW